MNYEQTSAQDPKSIIPEAFHKTRKSTPETVKLVTVDVSSKSTSAINGLTT